MALQLTSTPQLSTLRFSTEVKEIIEQRMSGPECCQNPPSLNSTSGEGTVENFAGLSTYITGPRDSRSAILLAADAFGYEAPLLRKLADNIAAHGFLVVVPDFYFGDPVNMNDRLGWMARHPPGKSCEDAERVIAKLKSIGVEIVGAAGFCWGGMLVVKLARFNSIKAAVILHPGPITDDEIKEVKVPVAILAAENDHIFPVENVKKLEAILSTMPEVDSFVKIYPGYEHGWACRYDPTDESAVKAAEEAKVDMLNWLTKYMK